MNRAEAGKLGGIKSIAKTKERSRLFREAYESAPKKCKHCNQPILFEKRANDFCNHSCGAKFNNQFKTKPLQTPCISCNGKLFRDRNSRYNKFCTICIENGKHFRKIDNLANAKQPSIIRRIVLESRPYQCEICKLSEWMGQKIPLQVDHIDGNHTNNTESNLRLLCCNCHAQTPTFGIRNKGNGRAYRRQRYAEGKSF